MVTSLWKYLEEVGGEATDPPSGVRRKTIHKHMSSLVQVLFNSLLIRTEIHGPSGYCGFFPTTLSLQEHSASFTQEDLCTHQANC